MVISFRKSRSNSSPSAFSSCSSCFGVAIPAIASWSCPLPRGPPLFFSHAFMAPISGFCPASMRSASARTRLLWTRPGTSRVISRACPWWSIIIWMYVKSAELGLSSGLRRSASSGDSVSASSPGLPGAITEGPAADFASAAGFRGAGASGEQSRRGERRQGERGVTAGRGGGAGYRHNCLLKCEEGVGLS